MEYLMAYVSTVGSKLTPAEQVELDVWGLIRQYRSYRPELIKLGNSVYRAAERALLIPPTQDQFYALYSTTVRNVNFFLRIAQDLQFPPALYDYFASLLAKYVVENDWKKIIAP